MHSTAAGNSFAQNRYRYEYCGQIDITYCQNSTNT